jgi:hypothetical protein
MVRDYLTVIGAYIDIRKGPDLNSSLFLAVKTLAVKVGLRPAKLPDITAFFSIVSLHTSALHLFLLRRRCGAEESSGIEPNGWEWRNQPSGLPSGGNARR